MPLQTEREKGAHLLRRFGLGASEAELDYYLKDGLNGAIDLLLDYQSIDEPFDYDLIDLASLASTNVRPRLASNYWLLQMLVTRKPLQHKMALFWHDHFATSAQKVASGPTMYGQVELLKDIATDDFRSILHRVSKDPAMLFWLDNQLNVKGKPNENFAREVMELFTLGEGNYTEDDIREAARAFTGWTLGRSRPIEGVPPRGAEFVFRVDRHDGETKSVLGTTGDLNGDDVIDILCDLPRTSEYLATKLWEWFAYPNPEDALVKRLAKGWRDNNLQVSWLLRTMMKSSEFYSEKAERSIYKNPIDFCVPTLRQLGVGTQVGKIVKETAGARLVQLPPVIACAQATNQMGMTLLYPPDVSGWEHGPAWVTSATMVARIQWADRLFGQPGVKGARVPFRADALFAPDPTPEGAVKTLLSVFDAPIPKEKQPNLVDAARKALDENRQARLKANAVGAAVSRLIFASPEFQFC